MSSSIKDISKLKVADLKRELKNRDLSTVGNKQELQDRLQMALQDGTDSALLLDDTGTVDTEDILNEDEVLGDEDDSSTNVTPGDGNVSLKRHLDDELEEETVTSTPSEKPSATQEQDHGPPAKKITLNRKAVAAHNTPLSTETNEKPDPIKSEPEEPKKVVKLTSLSASERLALRAAKFNVPIAADDAAKKEARCARFGVVSASSVTSASSKAVSVDTLLKRAARFGIEPGSKVEQVDMEERKKKRLERFGGGTGATNGSAKAATPKADPVADSAAVESKPGRIRITAPCSTPVNSSQEDKKKLRAERFKNSSAITTK